MFLFTQPRVRFSYFSMFFTVAYLNLATLQEAESMKVFSNSDWLSYSYIQTNSSQKKIASEFCLIKIRQNGNYLCNLNKSHEKLFQKDFSS